MKGLYFYKLSSPYQEDMTKDCKLTINEIDHNFMTLKNTDIKDITFDEENGLLTLSQINGDKFIAKIDLSHFTKDFSVEWNKENLALIFNYDGKTIKIDEFVAEILENSMTNIVQQIIAQTITDDTLNGVGVEGNPLCINPIMATGTYRAVEKVINCISGEKLPDAESLKKGDRFLSHENRNIYGNLYDYESIKKINDDLKSGWRIPTKEDWDNMLNAVELCDEYKNHNSIICNIEAGQFAGKLLKSNEYWKTVTIEANAKNSNSTNEPSKAPTSAQGVDSYGFKVLPAGYGNDTESVQHMGEQAEFWTITETDKTDVYAKRFFYDKSSVIQIAEEPKAVCSVRLVKDYDGKNFYGIETINGINYNTVLMPAENTEFGFSIWTTSNIGFNDEKYKPVLFNNNEIIVNEEVYYLNEWDGFKWLKREFIEGDSLVIKDGPDGDTNREYQLIDGKLVNIKRELRTEVEDVLSDIHAQIDGVAQNLATSSQEINTRIDEVISSVDGVCNQIRDVDDKLKNIETNVSDLSSATSENFNAINAEILVINEHINNVESERKAADSVLSGAIDANTSAISANTEAISALSASNETAHSTLQGNIDTVSGKINDVESESKAADEALHNQIESVSSEVAENEEVVAAALTDLKGDIISQTNNILELNAKIDNNKDATDASVDSLNRKIDDANNKIQVLEEVATSNKGRLISQDGSSYDCANGVITLATDDASKTITIQLTGNYGTF
jgi:uncharacterized protein (TIGR02145 family)